MERTDRHDINIAGPSYMYMYMDMPIWKQHMFWIL